MRNKKGFLFGLWFSMAVGLVLLVSGPSYLSAHNDDDHNSAYTQGERYGYDRGYEHGDFDV